MSIDMTLLGLICSAIAIGLSGGALVYTYVLNSSRTRRYDRSQQHSDTARIATVEQQMSLFWRLVEKRIASMLHAPTHHEMDVLLEKLKDQTISLEESRTLHGLIQERMDDLVIEGTSRPDLSFASLFTLWSLELRMGQSGEPFPRTPIRGHDGV